MVIKYKFCKQRWEKLLAFYMSRAKQKGKRKRLDLVIMEGSRRNSHFKNKAYVLAVLKGNIHRYQLHSNQHINIKMHANLCTKPVHQSFQHIINCSDFLFWTWGLPICRNILTKFRPSTVLTKGMPNTHVNALHLRFLILWTLLPNML